MMPKVVTISQLDLDILLRAAKLLRYIGETEGYGGGDQQTSWLNHYSKKDMNALTGAIDRGDRKLRR